VKFHKLFIFSIGCTLSYSNFPPLLNLLSGKNISLFPIPNLRAFTILGRTKIFKNIFLKKNRRKLSHTFPPPPQLDGAHNLPPLTSWRLIFKIQPQAPFQKLPGCRALLTTLQRQQADYVPRASAQFPQFSMEGCSSDSTTTFYLHLSLVLLPVFYKYSPNEIPEPL